MMSQDLNRAMSDEQLEDICGGNSDIWPYSAPYERLDPDQQQKLKAAVRAKRCACSWVPLTDDEVNNIIERWVMPGLSGYPCPRCGATIDAKGYQFIICR